MAEKLDIFNVLKKIDGCDREYYSSLSPEERKGFQPLIAMRWMSGCNSRKQIMMINTFLNPTVFNFYRHPDLLYKLMVTASDCTPKRYSYPKKATKGGTKPQTVKFLSAAFQVSLKEARSFLSTMTLDYVLELADTHGVDADTIKKIKNEFK